MDSQFIDLQLNGYIGVDFNADHLDADSLHKCCARLKDDGVGGTLATIITDHIEAMASRLTTLVRLRSQDSLVREIIWGLHIEGPFLNEAPGFIGAHPVDAACVADWDKMQRLLEAAGGLTRIVTLAPERDPEFRVTSKLADRGIVVAAGHCDSTLDELRAAIDSGLSMFTHLGNGCPMHMHRHDNIIQRVLSVADQLWISFIADGTHVDYPALSNYLKVVGPDRAIVVSDAIAAAGLGPGTYTLGPQSVIIGDDLVPWAEDRTHFCGSACPLPRMAANLRGKLGLSKELIERLVFSNPQRIVDGAHH